MVGLAKTSRGLSTRPRARARPTNWIELMLSPPRWKKLSPVPTRAMPSNSHSSASSGVRGG